LATAQRTESTAIYPALLDRVKDIVRGDENKITVYLAQQVHKRSFDSALLKSYIEEAVRPDFLDTSLENDLDF
jgi:hypothetical protein